MRTYSQRSFEFDLNIDLPESKISGAQQTTLDAIDDLFSELSGIEASASVRSEFVATLETPTEMLSGLPAPSREMLLETIRIKRDEILQDNKAHGHLAQAYDAVDLYRAGPGRESHNANKRAQRHMQAIEEGRPFKPRNMKRTPEEKRKQEAEASARRREKNGKEAESAKRKERRQRAKEREAQEAAERLAADAIM